MKHLFAKYEYFCVFLFGIIAGTCYVNLVAKYQIALPVFDIYQSTYLTNLADTSVQPKHLLLYVVKLRMRDYLLLWAVQFTAFSGIISGGYILFVGIGAGIFLSYAVIHFGLIGIVIYLLSILPQYIFYGICIYMIFICKKRHGMYAIEPQRSSRSIIILIMISFLMLTLGIYLEAYFNPVLIKWIYGHISF